MILNFVLDGQTLKKGVGFPEVVEKSNNFLTIRVDGIPDGYTASAYFVQSWDDGKTYGKNMQDGECVVDEYLTTLPENPSEYVDYKIGISVAGVGEDGSRFTSNIVYVTIDKTAYKTETENTPEIPISQFEDFVSTIQANANSAKESADLAKDSADAVTAVGAFTVIGDVTTTSSVSIVRFSTDGSGNPISDYRDFFLYFAGKFKNDLTGAELRVASGDSYWQFAKLFCDQSATVEQTFWCWVEEVATVNERVIRRSFYPSELLTQGGVAMNASGSYTNSPAVSNITARSSSRKLVDLYIMVPGVNQIASGSRIVLLGRKKR